MCGYFSVYSLIFRDRGLEDTLKALSGLGVKALEIRVHEDSVHLSPWASGDEGSRVRRLVEDYGLTVCALASYGKLGCEADRAEKELEKLLNVGRLADVLGAAVFRVKVRGYDPGVGYERIRKLFRKQAVTLVKMLKAAGVEAVPVVEQHGGGDLAHSAGILLDFLRGLEPERFGVLFDPGNAVKEGWLPLELQLDMLRPYVRHVHVKNYEWDLKEPGAVKPSPLDRGIVDWRLVVERLEGWGYRGFYSLEDFRPIPPEERVAEALAFFKGLGIE